MKRQSIVELTIVNQIKNLDREIEAKRKIIAKAEAQIDTLCGVIVAMENMVQYLRKRREVASIRNKTAQVEITRDDLGVNDVKRN